MRRWVSQWMRGDVSKIWSYRPPPFWGQLSKAFPWRGLTELGWQESNLLREPSYACLHRQANLSYPSTKRGIPGRSPLTDYSLQKLKPEQIRRIICKGRNNCNLPGDNCQVVSASEFCSHTTVTYQSLTSPARALGPVDIQEFNEPELALMVCMLTSRLVIHKFNISLKRKKLLPQRMMRMQELGRDYKRFCSFWRVAE